MSISFETAFSIHDDALILRSQRSSIIAANIANAETPHYKARDIDFKSVLQSVDQPPVGGRLGLVGTQPDHLSTPNSGFNLSLQYRNPLHASLDGNTVDSHVEQAQFAENALGYQTSLTFLSSRIQGILKALKGE